MESKSQAEEVGLLAEADALASAKAMYEAQKAQGDEKAARVAREDAALLDPFSLATCAMLAGAFVDNVCSALYDVPLKYYLYDDLGVSVRAYYVLSACTSLPSSLLPLFGLLSLVPIRGCHHKFYWILGYVLTCLCYLVLGASSGAPAAAGRGPARRPSRCAAKGRAAHWTTA